MKNILIMIIGKNAVEKLCQKYGGCAEAFGYMYYLLFILMILGIIVIAIVDTIKRKVRRK